jgi:ferredoxin
LRREAARRTGDELIAEPFRDRMDEMFDSALWDGIGERCVACGVCTYLCPTCHCFDIQDETHRGEGARVRNWDTCQFELFTRHASGHNPRSAQSRRVRQRIMHKFQYGPRNTGMPFCVGCGRCVAYCPVNIDLRRILDDIRHRKPS